MFNDSKCKSCHALRLRTVEQMEKIKRWHSMFILELNQIEEIKLILLGESYPKNLYFYDLDSNYEYGGLMYNLRQEFGVSLNADMIKLFRELGVIVYDCAYCPLCKLDNKVEQRHAATYCLKSYKLDFFNKYNVPIITFFPSKRGLLKRELPEISRKICSEYKFDSLFGIKQSILKNIQ